MILPLEVLLKLGFDYMKLSIISTTYNSEKTIGAFLTSLNSAVDIPGVEIPVSVIVVNDGSQDGSLEILLGSSQQNLELCVLDLARNYGHHRAIFSGIRHLDDDLDVLVIIDSDLEENPDEIRRLIEVIQETDSDVVITHVRKRANKFLQNVIAGLADLILRIAIGPNYVPRVCTLRIMRAHVALELKKNKEENPILGVAQQRLGLLTSKIVIEKLHKGTSQYTLRRKFRLFIQILVSSSEFHSRLALLLGFTGVSFSAFCVFWLLYNRIANSGILPGYSSIAVLITFFSGVLIFLASLIFRSLMKIINSYSGDSGTIIRSKYNG